MGHRFCQVYLKGQCHEILASYFFHESVSLPPSPRVSHSDRYTTGINDTGGLPPVSRTLGANFATSIASVVDNCGKFATGVNDTDGKFAAGFNDPGINDTSGKFCHQFR
jgi:hypothetical protein